MHGWNISEMCCSNSLSIILYTSLFIPAYMCACLVVSVTLWTVAHRAPAFSLCAWKGVSVCSPSPHSPFCSLGDGEVDLVSVNVEMENSCWTWPNSPKSSRFLTFEFLMTKTILFKTLFIYIFFRTSLFYSISNMQS